MASPIVIEIPPKPKAPSVLSPGATNEQWYWEEGFRRGYLSARSESPMVRFKAWWKSRTILFLAAVSASCTALALVVGDVKEAFGEYGAIAVVVLVGGGAFLRKITNTGLSK